LPLIAGTRLGPYEILSALGVGGMGEVYRARDTKLNRDVAIKVLLPAVANDRDRLARFSREAQVLASLNHPNIAHIHGLEESVGTPALVMELVEGPTLAARIRTGPIPLDEALPIAKQIADALEAAHEQGIIHRDLKPANIKVRPDGTVKVLDFGLAKALEAPGRSGGQDPSNSPTVTSPAIMTDVGVILGTAAYMSPEQAKGRSTDKRSDVWAFGCVLFEMLTGRRAFGGETVTETLASVMRDTPAFEKLPAATPSRIRLLIARCLERDSKRRLRDIGDARLELESRSEAEDALAVRRDSRALWRRSGAVAVVALAFGALVAAAIAWSMRRSAAPRSQPVVRFTIAPSPEQALEANPGRKNLAISPDGRYLVYPGAAGLFVRALDQLGPQLLPGTRGAAAPFFSPDGRWVGFFLAGDLKKTALAGGSVVTVARGLTAPVDGSWGDDDTIVFDNELGGLNRVAASGGQPEALTSSTSSCLGDPWMLPGAGAVLCTALTYDHPENAQISVLDLKTRQVKPLVRGVEPTYLKTGHVLYRSAGTLFAVPFDLVRREVAGEPVRIGDIGTEWTNGGVSYAVSATGTLAKVTADTRRSLVWVDRNGRETPTAAPVRPYYSLRLSPDGARAAALVEDEDTNILTWDFARDTLTRLIVGAPVYFVPAWMPNGRQLVFSANRTGAFNLYVRDADGSGTERRLTTSTQTQVPNSILPDDSFLLGAQLNPKTGWDIIKVPLSGNGTDTLVTTPEAEYAANISPNGRFFAYESFETGRSEILIRPYPDAGRRRWQISTSGGLAPVWSRSGRELFFLDGDSHTLRSVDVETSASEFTAGKPKPVLRTAYFGVFYAYDVSPDGQRFLFIKEAAVTNTIEIVVNWVDELRARLSKS